MLGKAGNIHDAHDTCVALEGELSLLIGELKKLAKRPCAQDTKLRERDRGKRLA